MSDMSDYLEDSLIDHIFRTTTWSKPTVLAIALLTTAAAEDDTGQFSTGTGVEVTNANAYAREAHNPLDANWDAPVSGNGVTANTSAITYTEASGSWGTVVAVGVVDSSSYDSGNLLFFTDVGTSRTIDSGDTAELAAGAITVTLD